MKQTPLRRKTTIPVDVAAPQSLAVRTTLLPDRGRQGSMGRTLHIGRLSPTPMPDLHSGGNGMLVEAVILLLAALVVVILGWIFGAV
jgi:hypothetical protein